MKYSTFIFVLIIFAAGLIVFQDAFRIYFTHEILACYIIYFTFADDFYIPECFYSNAFGHFPEYFLEIQGVYRPITTCLFAFNYLVWELNSFGYHITNFLVHMINAYLVFVLAKYFIRNKTYAMLCSVLFYFHSWNTSPVIVLIQLSGILCTTFYLAAIFCFVQYRTTESHRNIWLMGVVLSIFLAVSSYEMAITLPVLLVFLDLVIRRTGKGNTRTSPVIRTWYKIHVFTFLFICFYIVYRLIIFHGIGGYPAIHTKKSPHLILDYVVLKNYWLYVSGFMSECLPYPGIFAVLFVICAIAYSIMDKKGLFFLLWVLITPLPVINLFVNPYYFYLPSIGMIFIMYGFISCLFNKLRLDKPGLIVLVLVSVIMFGICVSNTRSAFHQRYQDNLDAREWIEAIYTKYPDLSKHTTIFMVIPQLVGRDKLGRNYYNLSLEHLLQLRYRERFLHCYPYPVIVKHRKFSDPGQMKFTENTLFLQRVGNEIIEFKNIVDATINIRR